jgi:hypothetical protein
MVTHGGNGGNGALSGRSLINTKSLSKAKRAIVGAKVLRGELDLKPTAKLVAQGVGCSVGYLHAAAKLGPAQEQRVLAGFRPLIEPKVKSPPVPAMSNEQLSDEELVTIVQHAGVGRVWDVIAKLIV